MSTQETEQAKNFYEQFVENAQHWGKSETWRFDKNTPTVRNSMFTDELFKSDLCPIVPTLWRNSMFQVAAKDGDIKGAVAALFAIPPLSKVKYNPIVPKKVRPFFPNGIDCPPGGFYTREGKVYRRSSDSYYEEPVAKSYETLVRDYLKLEQMRARLLKTERSYPNDADLSIGITAVNKEYDRFSHAHGKLKDKSFLAQDPRFYLTRWALEDKKGNPANFLKERVAWNQKIPEFTTIERGAQLSLGHCGFVSVDWVVKNSSFSHQQVSEQLLELGYIFPDWDEEGHPIFPDLNQYIEGNVYVKIDRLKTLQEKYTPAQYDRCMETLLKARPLPCVPPVDDSVLQADAIAACGFDPSTWTEAQMSACLARPIGLDLGHFLIPPEVYIDYVCYRFGASRDHVTINQVTINTWYMNATICANPNALGGADVYTGVEVVSRIMMGESPKIFRKVDEKIVLDEDATQQMTELYKVYKDDFALWLWSDHDRAVEIAVKYNLELNCISEPQPQGEWLEFPELTFPPGFEMYSYQKNAIWSLFVKRKQYLSLPCGAGKTLIAMGGALVMKLRGLCHKPVLSILKATKPKMIENAQKLCPGANILFARTGDLTGKENHDRFVATIMHGDWDLIILTHEELETIGLDPRILSVAFEEQLQALEERLLGDISKTEFKQIGAAIKRIQGKIQKIGLTVPSIGFEQSGIDLLLVDEAHLKYRKPGVDTKLYNSLPGIKTDYSDRAISMLCLIQWMIKKGYVAGFMSATPIVNSLVELYSTMRFFINDELIRLGILDPDAWISTFVQVRDELDFQAGGTSFGTRQAARGYSNIDFLLSLMRQYMPLVPLDEIKQILVGLPEAIEVTVNCKPTPGQIAMYDQISKRVAALQSNEPLDIPTIDLVSKPKNCSDEDWAAVVKARGIGLKHKGKDVLIVEKPDNHLWLNQHLCWGSLDPRVCYGSFGMKEDFTFVEGLPRTKVHECIHKVYQIWKVAQDAKATAIQIVFLDISTKKAGFFSVYEYLENSFQAMGLRVQVIHDMTDRSKLNEMADRGGFDVLIASTSTAGTGVELQKNLLAIHCLDMPPVPDRMVQRKGRVERVGNRFSHVFVFQYVTEGANGSAGADTMLYQLCLLKWVPYVQLLGGINPGSNLQDIGADVVFSWQEIKAIASGDPTYMTLMNKKVEISNLEAAQKIESRKIHTDIAQRRSAKTSIAECQAIVEKAGGLIPLLDGLQALSFRFDDGRELRCENKGGGSFKNYMNEEVTLKSTTWLTDYEVKLRTELQLQAYNGTTEITIATINGIIELKSIVAFTNGQIDIRSFGYRLSYAKTEYSFPLPGLTLSGIWDALTKTTGSGSSIPKAVKAAQAKLTSLQALLDSPPVVPSFDHERLADLRKEVEAIERDLSKLAALNNLRKIRFVNHEAALACGLTEDAIVELEAALATANQGDPEAAMPIIDRILSSTIATKDGLNPNIRNKLEAIDAILDREVTTDYERNEQEAAVAARERLLKATSEAIKLEDITFEEKTKEEHAGLDLVPGYEISAEAIPELLEQIERFPYKPEQVLVPGKAPRIVDWMADLTRELQEKLQLPTTA